MRQEQTTQTIIGAAMEVSNVLGAGFLEKVYRKALCEELRLRNAQVEEEVRYRIGYKRVCIGDYMAD